VADVTCPRCQVQNSADALFCDQCAAPLALTCRSCGAANRPNSKFCGQCATPLGSAAPARPPAPGAYTPKHLADRILSSKGALEGERKQVTVLFADLQGSMELLADRDPEDARKLLDPVLERMMDAVHRYEGTVNQVMGDGIMALFGAPLAHEDHGVRACYAALRMQELVKRYTEETQRGHGVKVQIRVGLNSGEVVVRAIGSDLHMDYTAVGQTTHLAARMEQLASPGSILLTAATLGLVEGYVAVKPLGLMPVKGLADPVEVYELTGEGPARTRLQAGARRGLTRFVARDAELEQLRRAHKLAVNGHGQVAAIIGEAGVGKSRLVHEFAHSPDLEGWLVLDSASVSYGKATSYLPVIALLKSYFKIQDRDDLREIRDKVTGTLRRLDGPRELGVPEVLSLLDVPVDDPSWTALDPAQRRQRTLDAVNRLLLREAREQPLLLIFEDLHWIDGETQTVLDGLVDRLPSARLLLLVSYRPEYQHAWGTKASYSQIRLDALPVDGAGALLEALLGDDPGLLPLKELLVKRGNPFFLEESVRTLMETRVLSGERGRYRLAQPIHEVQVPPTVQVMLAARIDRLLPEDKRLLQVCSVVGKDVPFGLLRAIAELPSEALRRGLDRLQAAEFLYETSVFGDFEYAFKHALTHDVTYGEMLHARRRELHARVVEAIEALHRDRLGEQIERLAHHAVQGDLQEKAVFYLRQAGLKAAARSALKDARTWFERALGVLDARPQHPPTLEQAFDIRLEFRPVLNQLGDTRGALARLREAETLAERLNDDHRRGRVCAYLTNIHSLLGQLDEAFTFGTRALEIARRLGDLKLRIPTTTNLVQMHHFRGEYGQAVELARDNLAALPPEWVNEFFGKAAPASVYDRFWLVMSLAQLGRFAEAAEHEAEALRLADATHHPFTIGQAYRGAGMLHLLQGDWPRARALFEHGLAAVRSGNVMLLLPLLVAPTAWTLAQLGATAASLDLLREGEQLLEAQAARGVVGNAGWVAEPLGRTCLLFGKLDEAARLASSGLESSSNHAGFAAHALHLLGDIASHPDRLDPEAAEARYREALALAEPRGMRPLIAHCHRGLGAMSRRRGKQSDAEAHVATAATLYREMDMPFWLGPLAA
jgi:class 3 adenylate cyclase/tetratricopeptide (TPR) repeat protein